MNTAHPGFSRWRPMVLKDWLKANRYGNEFFRCTDASVYWKVYKNVVSGILDQPNTIANLAVDNDNFDTVFGWTVWNGKVLHFVYVKKDARKHGIANYILPLDIEFFTHITKPGRAIWEKKFPTWKFNPF